MNWTGGRLSRHSRNARGSTQNVQREFFAKARNNLLSTGPKQSPSKWSVFKEVHTGLESGPLLKSNSAARHSKQEKLKTWRSNNLNEGEKSLDVSCINRNHLEYPNKFTSCTNKIPETNTVSSYSDSETRPVQYEQINGHTNEQIRIISRKSTRVFPTISAEDAYTPPAELIDIKRRMLLQKDDWIGMKIQRPLQLKYVPIRDEKTAKRRKITGSHHARYSTRKYTSPFKALHGRTLPYMKQSGERTKFEAEGPCGQANEHAENFRISIGGRRIHADVSPGTMPPDSHRDSQQISQITSSDVMLLDNVESPNSCELSLQDNESHYTDDSRARIPSLASIRHMRSFREIGGSQRDVQGAQNAICEMSPGEAHRQTPIMKPTNKNVTGRAIRLHSNQSLSSSMPVIHQPVPQSSRTSQILSSKHSNCGDSTSGQLGLTQPTIPLSQVSDDELWKSWLMPLYSDINDALPVGVNTDTSHHAASSISPGISILANQGQWKSQQRLMSIQHGSSFQVAACHDFEEIAPRGIQAELCNITYKDEPKIIHNIHLHKLSEKRARTFLTDCQKESHTLTSKSALDKQSERHDDPDAAWKRFIFTSDSEDHNTGQTISPNLRELPHCTPRKLSPLSMIAQASYHLGSSAQARNSVSSQSTIAPPLQLSTYLGSDSSSIHSSPRAISRSSQLSPVMLIPTHSTEAQPNSSGSGNLSAVSKSGTSQAKVVFTKPRPFIGQFSGQSLNEAEPKFVHLGGPFRAADRGSGVYKREARDIYSLPSSEAAESIEDD